MRFKSRLLFGFLNKMSFSHSASASRGSRSSKVFPGHQPVYHNFCRRCDICPTCGSSPHSTTTIPVPPAPVTPPTLPGGLDLSNASTSERILPQMPFHLLVTLFLIQTQLAGDWRPFVVPYALTLIIFCLPSVPPYLGEPADVLRRQIYLREPARRSTSPEARMVRTYWCEACPLQGGTNHAVPISQRAQHRADLATFQEKQTVSNPDAPDDVDTLANVFTGLVVTDDGPNVRGQQHSKLFSSRDDFQASISDIPLAFQPPPPSETLASIEAVVSAAPLRTALPTRKARRESTLAEILDRIRTAHKTLDRPMWR
ncbi:hypothetical protein C8F01DRAFT_1282743 [Mycena amicta]|nr:hypothetical protein C8F01DRAFT_1282743 [Mycena amicta]